VKISASLLAEELIDLKNRLPHYDSESIDYLHMDVMDGNFVPQISFGEAFTKEVAKVGKQPLDIHLMVREPEKHAPKYYSLKPFCITFHIETTNFGVRLAEEIRASGSKVGVTLNPSTPPEALTYLLPCVDLVLVMTVDPGFYGQSFVRSGWDKIRKLRAMTSPHKILPEVDGGVNETNIQELQEIGVDLVVVGSGLYKTGNPNLQGKRLKEIALGKTPS